MPPRRGRRNILAAIGGFVIALALAVGAFAIFGQGESAQELTVRLQPIGDAGPGPFVDSVVTVDAAVAQRFSTGFAAGPGRWAVGGDADDAAAPTTAPRSTASDSSTGLTPVAYSGDTSSLYGLDASASVCDAARLVELVNADADVTRAWAQAMGIEPGAVESTVRSFTPALLGVDTAVTNHFYGGDGAEPFQGVLQSGTAVLVDDRGTPRVQCSCGNPLAKPRLPDGPVAVEGTAWDTYDPAEVVEITDADEPLVMIEGIDIHNGEPTVVGAGDTATLDGYLVADDTGLSVVSADGETRTRIVDGDVGRAFDDGMGGVVYEEIEPNASSSSRATKRIMWLGAAQAAPLEIATSDPSSDMSLAALDAGRFDGRWVLFYARQDHSSTNGVFNQGAGSQLIVRDLESGDEHVVTAPDDGDVEPEFLAFAAGLTGEGTVGPEHLLFDEYQGTAPALFEVDTDHHVHSIGAPVCADVAGDTDFDMCAATGVRFAEPDAAEFVVEITRGDDHIWSIIQVDLPTGTVIDRVPLDDISGLTCTDGFGLVKGAGGEAVVSFIPRDDATAECTASVIDLDTHEVTALPFAGLVVPLVAPVIRPVSSSEPAPPTTPPTTVATPAPTTTTPPGPTMNLDQIAAGDYTSLAGTWVPVALSSNPHDGTGPQWEYTDMMTIDIFDDEIVINGVISVRGDTVAVAANGQDAPMQLVPDFSDGHLELNLADDQFINWTFRFFPAGSTDLDDWHGPNNGVTLDSSRDAISFWTSNNGHTGVFARVE